MSTDNPLPVFVWCGDEIKTEGRSGPIDLDPANFTEVGDTLTKTSSPSSPSLWL